ETVFLPTPPTGTPGWDWGASEMVEDDDGWIWVATLDGVHRFRPDAPGRPERHTLLLPGGIATQNFVTALYRDRAGTLWAGTVWGLHRHDPHADRFRLLAHDPTDPASLGSGLVLSLYEDAGGALWVGTLGGGLNRYDPATGRARRYPWGTPGGTSGSWIWALDGDGAGGLWVATGAGLDRVDVRRPDAVRSVPVRHLTPAPESVYRVRVDPTDGTLWVGEFGGLLHRTAAGERVALRLPDSTGVEDVLADAAGVWVATSDGLYRLDRRTGRARRYRHDPADPASLTHDATLCLFRDSRGRLWIGTNSGLNRFDPATDGFTALTAADGLPSDVVYALLEDDEGRLWISTNRGLARYDERAAPDRRLRAFTVADGVGNVEFNRRAAFQGRDGTLYFGGDRGVTAFHPRDIHDNPYRPPVVIAPDAYTFAFEFAALGFTNPPRQRYAVRMEGWEEGWVDLGAERRATYTNLPPGRYTFRVRAANEDGVWSAAGAAVPVVVRPWFWQTWWFRGLAGLVVLGAVAGGAWGASRARYRRALVRLEARRALEAERARISRDVHDEVGASLTEIAILSELARRAPGDGAAPHLDRIATTSRAMVGALGEIVWAVNPKNDRLPALAAYLREHAARYLEAAGLEARIAFPQPVPDRPVSAELRRNVFLVLKEALHNVVKHAGATYAEVTFALEPGGLALTVRDDGCGFLFPQEGGANPAGDGAPARASGGDGLGNLRRRAAEVGGVLVVTSAPGGGTTVHLTVPLVAALLQPPPSV
ncbi:MAG TPA: two-component regulator propeller domain-containing protein, partial [Rhodothermales bacterium]|nr:two-component regulator propeller domain-containing protein [Rhodothermales bacterium]